jgi:predicted nucleic acid-binding protein
MNQTLDRFTGAAVYLDTMLPYALLRGVEPAAKAFFERIEQGALAAYTSALTFDELAYRLLLALIRDHYGGAPLDLLRADEVRLITEFAPAVAAQLQRLRCFPYLYAAMQRVGCLDLASHDAHFDRIPLLRRFVL